MKVLTYKYPKSSFLSIEKDMGIIIDMIFKNERLKKLLLNNTKDALLKPYDEKYMIPLLSEVEIENLLIPNLSTFYNTVAKILKKSEL
jgi:hypothetical protein